MKLRPRWLPERWDARSRARTCRGLAFAIGVVALLTVWVGAFQFGRPLLVAVFGLLFLLQLRDAKPGQRMPWDTRLAETLALLAGLWVVVMGGSPAS